MPIWKTISVKDQPIIRLSTWGVFAVPGESEEEDHHFYGWHSANIEGRVSSKIMEFDPKTRVGLTRSGRHYQLEGASGQDEEAIYVMVRWFRINSVEPGTVRDVTTEYTPRVQGE